MAKGKRSSGKTYVSKGERRSSMKTPNKDKAQKMLNKMDALYKGKDVVFTMENPNKEETNRQFIKVRVNGKQFLDRLKNSGNNKKKQAGNPEDS